MHTRLHLFGAGLLAASACGIVRDDPDASTDAEPDTKPQCTNGTFGPPVAFAELDTGADECGLRLTRDERIAVFSRGSSNSPALIFASTRSNVTSTFAAPVAITNDNQNSGLTTLFPTLSRNGQTLFVESTCNSDVGNVNSPICRLDTDGGVSTYLTTQWKPYLIDKNVGNGGFGAGFAEGDGFATEDGLTYYAVANVGADAGPPFGIYESKFDPPTATPWQAATERVLVFWDGVSIIDDPVASADQLTLFLSFTTPTQTTPHIAFATRPSLEVAFGALTPLPELDSPEGEYPSWISGDLCRLYLTRRVNGQSDLFVASRSN